MRICRSIIMFCFTNEECFSREWTNCLCSLGIKLQWIYLQTVGFPNLCWFTGRIYTYVHVEMIWSKWRNLCWRRSVFKQIQHVELMPSTQYQYPSYFSIFHLCWVPLSPGLNGETKALSGPLSCAGVCGGELTGSFFVKNRASGDCAVMASVALRPSLGTQPRPVPFCVGLDPTLVSGGSTGILMVHDGSNNRC